MTDIDIDIVERLGAIIKSEVSECVTFLIDPADSVRVSTLKDAAAYIKRLRNPWVAIDKMSPLLEVPSSPNGGYVDILNKSGSRFPDAVWVVETGTIRRGYWQSASGHEIDSPAFFMLPPKGPSHE